MKFLHCVAAAVLVAALALPASGAGTSSTWPSISLYQVDAALETADGHHARFANRSDRVRVVTMFYASCPMACPLTIDTLKNLDAALTPAERAKVDVLLLSMDPARDTPRELTRVATERHISDPRWMLARASLVDTRKLAAVLGIQYRELNNGDFDHASVLVLLDGQGRVLSRSGKLGTPAPEFVAAVRVAARAP